MKTFFGKLGAVLRRTWVWSLLLVLLLLLLVTGVYPAPWLDLLAPAAEAWAAGWTR